MSQTSYRILGAELSPYSVKVRSWFRYKRIDHRWEVRSPANQREFEQRAKLPLVPLVITPQDETLQDSTPLMEKLEQRHPQPACLPDDEGLRFLSALLEEYGDEWGNKWMFHLRWARPEDQQASAERLAQAFTGEEKPADETVQAIRRRMVPRVSFVGSNEQTAPQIEESYRQALKLLQAHLQARPFLLGSRPCFGDFGLWGQLYNCLGDPTAGRWMREQAPALVRWVHDLLDPQPDPNGDWESWESLSGTLFPLLQQQIGSLFLPWSDANANALQAGQSEMRVDLQGREWHQAPQKYHARSLAVIRGKFADLSADSWCRGVLAEAGCARWLQQD